jgi:poly-gamma-glutamate capsule biosynthesis protein CapA/YwtB (metallophosphatase superfamily)
LFRHLFYFQPIRIGLILIGGKNLFKIFKIVTLLFSILLWFTPYHQVNSIELKTNAKETSYFITKQNLPIYDNSTGKLIKIAEIKSGHTFKRLRDYGNWHEISFGSLKGYVKEESTVFTSSVDKGLFKTQKAIGKIKIKGNAPVYDNRTQVLIQFATILKGQTIEYTHDLGNWYGVLIGGRRGYIHHSLVNEIDENVRLSFAGDAMMDWSVKTTIAQKGADYPFIHVKKELVSSDLGIVNLETAVTTSSNKTPKQYNFKSNPVSLTGLKNAGFQLVSLANNHTLDYQTTGLRDTLTNLKKYKLDYVGGGLNSAEAYAAKTYQLKGKTIKILAFSRVLPDYNWVATASKPGLANGYDLSLINRTIKNEKKNADYVFVYIHWGVETKRTPEAFQRQWAKAMIDSGADGIMGSHPHVLQGFEYYKGKPIAYSLGNFLFPNYVKGDKAQTTLVHLDIKGKNISMVVTPYKIYKDQIIPQGEKDKQRVWKELEKISYGTIKIVDGKILY